MLLFVVCCWLGSFQYSGSGGVVNADFTSSCRAEICRNGGTCHEDLKKTLGFRCECPIEYTGYNCQIRKRKTIQSDDNKNYEHSRLEESNPCLNGGTFLKDGVPCACTLDFTGSLCGIRIRSAAEAEQNKNESEQQKESTQSEFIPNDVEEKNRFIALVVLVVGVAIVLSIVFIICCNLCCCETWSLGSCFCFSCCCKKRNQKKRRRIPFEDPDDVFRV